MYRKLKNILGVSLMILAIVISQIPMPETQAKSVGEMTKAEMQVDDESSPVVTFSMNGGTFNGEYNGYKFQDMTPVLVIDHDKKISSFPSDQSASYSGYKTEKDTWYTDTECLIRFDKDSPVKESMTLYKKWYNITSDGTTLAPEGFHISADGTVLYRYDGEDTLVKIPQTVTTIADGVFDDLDQNVRGIVLPAGIAKIGENAFDGIEGTTIVYVYDSGTTASRDYGKQLAEKYEKLVYSEYLDPEKTEEIAGISYLSDSSDEETAETPEGSAKPSESIKNDGSTEQSKPTETDEEGSNTESSGATEESSSTESSETEEESGSTEPTETDEDESNTESSETDEDESNTDPPKTDEDDSSTVPPTIEIDPDQQYTVTFDVGITGVSGEEREVSAGKTVSERVSVNGKDAEILRIGVYQIERNEGKQTVIYTFRGWFKDNECTERWDFNNVIERNTTIYAKWDRQVKEQPASTYTVTFHMNGGGFTGNYNGTSYTNASSLTAKVTEGKGISSAEYPGNGTSTGFKYSNYSTDTKWYKDRECLDAYEDRTALNGDLTLYKKWYQTSSGFTMNASKNVLYKYSGSVEEVAIPDSVTVIGSDAFASMGGISGITLPDNISEVRDNAFSGVKNVSKDITITGKTEKAKKVAKELANQYTRLVYKDSGTSETDEDDSVVVVNRSTSGSIKLGATVSGSAGSTGNTTNAAANTEQKTSTIVLGTGGSNTVTVTGVQPEAVSQPAASSQSAETSQNIAAPAREDAPASATQGAKTTRKQNMTSASAPKSTQHIKDSTPKTGDPLQYRMLIVCAMFSVGVLLVLTGNGKKKKFSAS